MVGADRHRRVDVLGVHVSAVDMASAVGDVARWIAEDTPHYVCVTGVHGVMEAQGDERLREIHNQSGLTTPDGMPMVWSARYAGAKHVSRVYGPDLMLAIAEVAAERAWRFFFYGGKEGVAEQLSECLTSRYPGLKVVGWHSPPFRPLTADEDRAVVDLINACDPHLVWVGLSTPKQERWMAAHRDRLRAPVLLGVGAAFDICAGVLPQAPPWMQRSGLEWLYRMAKEPRRLWRRYLFNNPRFLLRIFRSPPRMVVTDATHSRDGAYG